MRNVASELHQNIYIERISCEEMKGEKRQKANCNLRIEGQLHLESQHSTLIHIKYVKHLGNWCYTGSHFA